MNNIPANWTIKKLDVIAKIQRGRFCVRPRNDPAYYGGDMPFVQTGDISQSKTFLKNYSQTLNNKGISVSKVFPKNTILITIAANIGDTSITTFPVACPDSLIGINNKSCDVFWLNYFLQTQKNKLNGLATQNAQKNINLETLNNLKIAVPPIAEQKKIAGILGTWDRAIEELTGLIAEKKELKRGLMQRLLTGTQRLPGFTKTWKNTKLGDIGVITSAGVDKKSIEGEKTVKLLNYMDVYRKDFLFASDVNMDVTASDRQIVNCNLKKGDVFFTPSSETRDDIAHSAVVMEDVVDGVYSYHIIRLRPTTEIDIKYTAYAFKTGMFYKQAYALCEGSGQRYVLSQNYFRNMKIYIPSDPAEQKAIADVLSKADLEIDLLNQQLDVLREQKCGLMQKLLTGEIRVKTGDK